MLESEHLQHRQIDTNVFQNECRSGAHFRSGYCRIGYHQASSSSTGRLLLGPPPDRDPTQDARKLLDGVRVGAGSVPPDKKAVIGQLLRGFDDLMDSSVGECLTEIGPDAMAGVTGGEQEPEDAVAYGPSSKAAETAWRKAWAAWRPGRRSPRPKSLPRREPSP